MSFVGPIILAIHSAGTLICQIDWLMIGFDPQSNYLRWSRLLLLFQVQLNVTAAIHTNGLLVLYMYVYLFTSLFVFLMNC